MKYILLILAIFFSSFSFSQEHNYAKVDELLVDVNSQVYCPQLNVDTKKD